MWLLPLDIIIIVYIPRVTLLRHRLLGTFWFLFFLWLSSSLHSFESSLSFFFLHIVRLCTAVGLVFVSSLSSVFFFVFGCCSFVMYVALCCALLMKTLNLEFQERRHRRRKGVREEIRDVFFFFASTACV